MQQIKTSQLREINKIINRKNQNGNWDLLTTILLQLNALTIMFYFRYHRFVIKTKSYGSPMRQLTVDQLSSH